jgi:hypothetical protein
VGPQGAAEEKKRENDVHLRHLEKKVCMHFFYYLSSVRFWAFLGKGSSKTRENNSVRLSVSKKKHRGNIVLVFYCVDFFYFFFLRLF